MAAYIDLNAVRKGLVSDPKDYRFCGYAEAVAGSSRARKGLQGVLGKEDWDRTQSDYRQVLYGTGAGDREKAVVIDREAMDEVLRLGGRLPLTAVLRCRLRYLTDGAVLGSRLYVSEQIAEYRRKTGRARNVEPQPLPLCADCGELTVMRKLRGAAFGSK